MPREDVAIKLSIAFLVSLRADLSLGFGSSAVGPAVCHQTSPMSFQSHLTLSCAVVSGRGGQPCMES